VSDSFYLSFVLELKIRIYNRGSPRKTSFQTTAQLEKLCILACDPKNTQKLFLRKTLIGRAW